MTRCRFRSWRPAAGVIVSLLAALALAVPAVASAQNTAPEGVDDHYSVVEDTTLDVSAPGVLANDVDADGDAIHADLIAGPAHGTIGEFLQDGSFQYIPNPGYNGLDSFAYAVSDGDLFMSPVNILITVVSDNLAPTAADDSYLADEARTLNVAAPGVLANDSDPDVGDTLSAHLFVAPSHGTVTLNLNGSFAYTGAAGYSGPDSFGYAAADDDRTGSLTSNLATVSLTVRAIPHVVGDSYTLTGPELAVAAPGVLGNDTHAEGRALTAVMGSAPGHGTVSLSANGGFRYTPANGFSGTDTFTYFASDGRVQSSPATVTITVGVNKAPTIRITQGRGRCQWNYPSVFGVFPAAILYFTVADPDDPVSSVVVSAYPNRWNAPGNPFPSPAIAQVTPGTGQEREVVIVTPRQGTDTVTVIPSDGKTFGEPIVIKFFRAWYWDIEGTAGPDILMGSYGFNSLSGLAGQDLLCGGPGPDRLRGGPGADRFHGAGGNDTLLDFTPGQGDSSIG